MKRTRATFVLLLLAVIVLLACVPMAVVRSGLSSDVDAIIGRLVDVEISEFRSIAARPSDAQPDAGVVPESVTPTAMPTAILPTMAAAQARDGVYPTYVVKKGDSLSSIAARYGTSMQVLIDLNKDQYPSIAQSSQTNRIQVGWVLRLPPGSREVTPRPTVVNLPTTAVPAAVVTPATGPAASANGGGAFDYTVALEIVQLANAERAKVGAAPLAVDERLMEVARKRAVEIASNFSHNGLRDDCALCGENLAWNFNVGASVFVQQWKDSEGHRRNMLSTISHSTGVGVYRVGRNTYAVQLFE